MTDMKSMSKSELEDKLTACLKKAGGIAALINLSTVGGRQGGRQRIGKDFSVLRSGY